MVYLYTVVSHYPVFLSNNIPDWNIRLYLAILLMDNILEWTNSIDYIAFQPIVPGTRCSGGGLRLVRILVMVQQNRNGALIELIGKGIQTNSGYVGGEENN